MIQPYSIADTFGISAPASMTVEGFVPAQNPYVPVNKPYVFRKDHLRDVLAFLGFPNGDGLYLTGPTGSGKTSLLEQVAARLHWGVHAVTGHGRLELNDLLGQYRLAEGGAMHWIDGPLTLAVRLGHVLLLNEIDAVDPAELIGLNEIVEGKPLTIPQTGAVIMPHPKFRLVATGNSRGCRRSVGLVSGRVETEPGVPGSVSFTGSGLPRTGRRNEIAGGCSAQHAGDGARQHDQGRQSDPQGLHRRSGWRRHVIGDAVDPRLGALGFFGGYLQKRPQCLGLCPGQSLNLQGGTCRTRSDSSYRQGCFWR